MDKPHISQIELIAAICKHLDKNCGIKRMLPRQYNTLIRCVNEIIDEMQIPEKFVTPGCGLKLWLQSDQTGSSSLTMAHVMAGHPHRCKDRMTHPLDPSDFGRCLGLLEACPELREKLPIMSDQSPQWKALVDHWDEIESLYREELPSGKATKCYELMGSLIHGK